MLKRTKPSVGQRRNKHDSFLSHCRLHTGADFCKFVFIYWNLFLASYKMMRDHTPHATPSMYAINMYKEMVSLPWSQDSVVVRLTCTRVLFSRMHCCNTSVSLFVSLQAPTSFSFIGTCSWPVPKWWRPTHHMTHTKFMTHLRLCQTVVLFMMNLCDRMWQVCNKHHLMKGMHANLHKLIDCERGGYIWSIQACVCSIQVYVWSIQACVWSIQACVWSIQAHVWSTYRCMFGPDRGGGEVEWGGVKLVFGPLWSLSGNGNGIMW